MHLQNLEISGFKSFPERARLIFDDGVTAIVGPNGCGKSNVIDAITWVLGEQSAKSLRGERMEDVIFSGSDARKAIGTAEVRMMLARVAAAPGMVGGGPEPAPDGAREASSGHRDGADGTAATPVRDGADLDELLPLITRNIEVGRRLYRSGESEYLIDGRVCRLRDIQDLLMDSGVGVKAYAVIEQGKIGQILGARPPERRQLIEEAAGVTKYKSRRRSAELKLEAARQNLTRVDDIVHEVEKQRRALKRQAAKARRYRRLREDLRRWETVRFARRHQMCREVIERARTRLAEARLREAAAASLLARVEGDRERCRIELMEAEDAAREARDAAHERELAVNRRQQQITFDTRRVETLGATLAEMERDVADLVSRQDPARREFEEQVAAAERCGAERDALRSMVQRKEEAFAQAQRDLDGLEGDVETARSEMYAVTNAATALRHAVDNAASGQMRLAETMSKLDAEAGDLDIELQTIANSRAKTHAAELATREALARVRGACAERVAELSSLRAEHEARTRELRDQEQELAGLTGRLTSLRDMETTRAGYSDAVRLLLSTADSGIRQLGSVADHLEVLPGHERAVEACLGDLLQYVVVPSWADAEAGLDFTRQHGAGRGGFLVLDGAVTQPVPPPPADGLVSVASVVRVDGRGADAIRAEIADCWLAGSYDEAERAASRSTALIATPEGDVFHGTGRVSGGAKGGALGILAAKREIRDLNEQIVVHWATVARLGDRLGRLDVEINRSETALAEATQELHQHEKAMLGHEMQRAARDEEEQRLNRKRDVIATERRSAAEEHEVLEARQTEANVSIERIRGEQRIADERFAASQRRVLDARGSLDALSREVVEAKAAHAALVERSSALEASVVRFERANQELAGRLAHQQAKQARTRTTREELVAAVASSTRRLDADIAGLATLRAKVQEADEQALGRRAHLDTGDSEVRVARSGLEERRAEVAELDVVRATAEGDLAHLEDSCRVALQMSLDEVTAQMAGLVGDGGFDPDAELRSHAVDIGSDEDDEAAVDTQPAEVEARPVETPTRPMTVEDMVALLKTKIDRLGPVNMMAIDEFDDLEARYDFLTTQRRDLEESIKATGDAIARINRTTRERFRDAFEAINTHFQDTFSTLFGGGRAGLVLLDETDLLESGIEIIAQPPGKRLQNIQLLSGGEKALSAMALMFAIFRYKPSPFCLLDEIDAPLDEANIGRFVEMLRGMQSDTQFILVTHNRKTMEIADRLYGVTMEEPGVSKLISVQLGQA